MSTKNFRELVRSAEIRQPHQRGFSIDTWTDAFQSSNHDNVEDINLYNAGLWFHERLDSVRHFLSSQSFSISRDVEVRLQVGAINFLTKRLMSLSLAKNSPFLHHSDLIKGAFTIPTPVIESITAFISMLRYPLSKTMQNDIKRSARIPDFADIIQFLNICLSTGIIYDSLENLWNECVWNNWFVDILSDKDVVRPTNAIFETHRSISEYRRESLIFEIGNTIQNMWPNLPENIRLAALSVPRTVAIQPDGDVITLFCGYISGELDSPPQSVARGIAVEEIYFNEIISANILPVGLSVRQILNAWEIIASAAELIDDHLPKYNKLASLYSFFRCSPLIDKKNLTQNFEKYLGISQEQAQFIFNLFSFSGSPREDLWIKPLVPVTKDFYTMILTAVTSTNLLRLIDYWMRSLGIDLSERGPAYEKFVRKEIYDCNKIKSVEVFLQELTFKFSNLSEEIDLAIRIGNSIIIGEIKCSSQPSSANETYRYFRILEDGASQAARKAKHVREDIVGFADQINWNIDTSRPVNIIPLVVTNLETGCGINFKGIPVVDLRVLTRYFERDDIEQLVVFNAQGDILQSSRRILYTSDDEAEAYIADYLTNPPQIAIYRDNAKEELIPLLSLNNGSKPTFFYYTKIMPPTRAG